MKAIKQTFASLVILFGINSTTLAFGSQSLIDSCWDGSFAYMHLSVEKDSSKIKFLLSSQVSFLTKSLFPELGDIHPSDTTITLEMPLRNPKVSANTCAFHDKNPMLLHCAGSSSTFGAPGFVKLTAEAVVWNPGGEDRILRKAITGLEGFLTTRLVSTVASGSPAFVPEYLEFEIALATDPNVIGPDETPILIQERINFPLDAQGQCISLGRN